MNALESRLFEALRRTRGQCLAVGVLGLALFAVGLFVSPAQFFRSYLLAFLFWMGIPLACLGFLMISHLTGGGWAKMTRRLLESAAVTLPFMAILFIPLAIGLKELYPWTDLSHADELLKHKAVYLNSNFFLGRAAFYFLVWSTLAFLLNKAAASDDAALERRKKALSAGGLVIFVLTASFASVDWVMSLDPHWFSSIFGAHFLIGQGVAALSFLILFLSALARQGLAVQYATPDRMHDLGNLLLAFVMLWAYMALSQFLLIWSANLPLEITFYLARRDGFWQKITVLLFTLHFAVPFFLLLFRNLKRNPESLSRVALLLLVAHALDLIWLIKPMLTKTPEPLSWAWDLAALVGVGSLWLALFLGRLVSQGLWPAEVSRAARALPTETHA